MLQKQWFYRAVAILCFFCLSPAWAHGYKAEKIQLDHPYAVENPDHPGQYAVYFRTFKNTGTTPDVLIGAQTSVAQSVLFRTETHSIDHEITWVEVKSIAISPGKAVVFRHDDEQGYQLLLQGLKKPLNNGDRFTMTLDFQHAGKSEVKVWVQQPRNLQKTHQH
jgi:copper(I)-binding protein